MPECVFERFCRSSVSIARVVGQGLARPAPLHKPNKPVFGQVVRQDGRMSFVKCATSRFVQEGCGGRMASGMIAYARQCLSFSVRWTDAKVARPQPCYDWPTADTPCQEVLKAASLALTL